MICKKYQTVKKSYQICSMSFQCFRCKSLVLLKTNQTPNLHRKSDPWGECWLPLYGPTHSLNCAIMGQCKSDSTECMAGAWCIVGRVIGQMKIRWRTFLKALEVRSRLCLRGCLGMRVLPHHLPGPRRCSRWGAWRGCSPCSTWPGHRGQGEQQEPNHRPPVNTYLHPSS